MVTGPGSRTEGLVRRTSRMKRTLLSTSLSFFLLASISFMSAQSFAATGGGGNSGNPPPSSADESAELCEEHIPNDAVPQLPAGDPNDTTVRVLKVGETMRFEEVGPVIINADGTTRRINNWDQMTEHEREVTWRRISKRNAQRRAALEEKMKQIADDSNAP